MSAEKKLRVDIGGSISEIEPPNAFVTELESGHFLVRIGDGSREVFAAKDGTLGDGRALSGLAVSVESERERIIRERFKGAGTASAGAVGGHTVKAPMPGLVRSLSVAVGDIVQKNSTLLVLEAMKMENNITAGVKGRVQKVLVEQGNSVEKNAKLIEIELEA